MSVTVWGECGGPNTAAASYDRYGRLRSAHSYRELEPELPAGGIELDCDHDGVRVGELVYLERSADDRLQAVCVLDNDGLEQVERPVFLSPSLSMRGPGIDRSDTYIASTAELLGLSLTFATARVGALPLRWRAGDLRSSPDRYKWPVSWRSSAPLLARALDSLGDDRQVRTRSASRIVDQRERELDHLVGRSAHSLTPEDWAAIEERAWKGRPLRHGPRGRVLDVR